MIELKTNLLDLKLNLKKLLPYNYILYSILDGSVEGKVFVDKFPDPKVVLIWDVTSDSGLYIEGSYSREIAKAINSVLLEKIFPYSKKFKECRDFTCCIEPFSDWVEYIEKFIFRNIYVRQDKRKFFNINV